MAHGLKAKIMEAMQRISWRSKLIEPADEIPKAVHHYIIVDKPGAKIKKPTDIETLNGMGTQALESLFRSVLDTSPLSGFCLHTPDPDPPTILQCLFHIEVGSCRSFLDIKRSFHHHLQHGDHLPDGIRRTLKIS